MGRQPCCDKSGLKRGSWTIEEDQKLINFIANNGIHCWRLVPKLAGLMRCGKSCRLRWTNYLRPDLKRGPLSEAEEDQIIQLHSRLGNRWSKIASHFPSRTDNEIKNLWNTKIKKRLKLHTMPIVENKESSAVAHNIEPHEYYSCPPPELVQEDQFKKEVDDGEVISSDAHEEMMNNNDNVLVVPVQQANTCTTSSSCSTPFSLDETLINTSTVEGADQASNYWSDSLSSWEALSYLEDVLSFVNFP